MAPAPSDVPRPLPLAGPARRLRSRTELVPQPVQMKGGPSPIVVPVIMVLMVAKYRTTAPWGGDQGLELLPILAGFITNYAANLAQAIYPDYELTLLEAKEVRGRGRE